RVGDGLQLREAIADRRHARLLCEHAIVSARHGAGHRRTALKTGSLACRNGAATIHQGWGLGEGTTMSMFSTSSPRPMIPSLAETYAKAEPWAYVLLRVVAGAMLIPHGWPKVMAGPAAVAAGAM